MKPRGAGGGRPAGAAIPPPAAGVDQNGEPGVQTHVGRGSHAMDGDPK